MKKPSKIKVVTAKKASLLPSMYRAITLFGVVYCHSMIDVMLINDGEKIDNILKSHETIHVRQAENTKDSWLLYYLNYIWQWICNTPLVFVKPHYIYKFIPYELEAYANENDFEYASGTANQWRMFKKKLSIKDKWKYAKEYKNSRMLFRDFVNNVILKEINGEG